MFLIIFIVFFISPLGAQSLPLSYEGGRIRAFSWNGATPLSLPQSYSNLSVYFVQKGVETLMNTEAVKEMGADLTLYSLSFLPSQESAASLKIVDKAKGLFFRTSQAPVSWNTNTPVLELISSSSSITRGGAAVVVLRSEPRKNLKLLAFVDESDIPYYPQTFKKDGYYSLIFPWYLSHGKNWDKSRIVAMDAAGNISEIKSSSVVQPEQKAPASKRIVAKNRIFKDRSIILGNNYGMEKAKELNLSPEEAKKLETNILAINAALSQATTRFFDRWAARLPFETSIARTVSKPSEVFKRVSSPIEGEYRITATFGDRRRYFFQKKQVRESTHVGQDMAKYPNMPVFSILDGKVIYADWNRGNGKTIVIDHGMDILSFYAHNSEFTVKEGAKVKAGQQIAVSGTTGQSTGDHLHLSIIVQGMYIQPTEWLSKQYILTQFVKPLLEAEKIIEGKPAGGLTQPQPLLAGEPSPKNKEKTLVLKETWLPAEKKK